MNKREMIVLVFPEVKFNDIEDSLFGVQEEDAAYELLSLMLDNDYSSIITTPTGETGVAFYAMSPMSEIKGIEAWVNEFVKLTRKLPSTQMFVIDDIREVLKVTIENNTDVLLELLGTLEFAEWSDDCAKVGNFLFRAGPYCWKAVKND